MKKNPALDHVMRLTQERFGGTPKANQSFKSMGGDELDNIEMTIDLEKKYRRKIPDSDAAKFKTPNHIAKYLNKKSEHMNAFQTGFMKRAMEYGYTKDESIQILNKVAKREEPQQSDLRRYFAQKALRSQLNMTDAPKKTFGGMFLDTVPNALIGSVNPLGNVIKPVQAFENMSNRENMKRTEKEREKALTDVEEVAKKRSIGGAAWHGARQTAEGAVIPGALIGALAMGLAGAKNGGGPGALGGGLVGAGLGGGVGAATGGILGAIRGLLDKKFIGSTNRKDLQKAKKNLSKHPVATGLPFGDL